MINDVWCNHESRWEWHAWDEDFCPTENLERGSVVPVTPILSAALDEIYRLRTHLAVEAARMRAVSSLSAVGEKRRARMLAAASRMEKAARGESVWPSEFGNEGAVVAARKDAGMPSTMTRAQWEEQTFPSDT